MSKYLVTASYDYKLVLDLNSNILNDWFFKWVNTEYKNMWSWIDLENIKYQLWTWVYSWYELPKKIFVGTIETVFVCKCWICIEDALTIHGILEIVCYHAQVYQHIFNDKSTNLENN